MYRNVDLRIRLSPAEAEHLDKLRGIATRSAYVRSVLFPPDPAAPPKPPLADLIGDHTHDWKPVGSIFKECTTCHERKRR